MAKLYYSTYICQLWLGDSKQMSNKAIKKRAKGHLRDLEGSYFCLTDQSMAALVWLRAAMLLSVPGVEIHLHTSHSILLLPVLNLKRKIEQALQSMNGRGTHIFNSNCVSFKTVTLRLKSFIVIVETFFAADTKENCQPLKLVSIHYRNKAWINKYRDSFLLKLLWTILIVLLYIFINLLRTETTGNLSDFR